MLSLRILFLISRFQEKTFKRNGFSLSFQIFTWKDVCGKMCGGGGSALDFIMIYNETSNQKSKT